MVERPLMGPAGPLATPTPEQVEEQTQRQRQAIEQQYRSDLLQGATMTIVGALLWPLHTWGRRRLIRAGNGWTTFLARTHLTVLLVLFGVVGLISLPTGIYQFLQFFLVPVDEFQSRQPPGESVALAIVFVPLWLISLVIAVREMRRESR